jgi:hypothetical protein
MKTRVFLIDKNHSKHTTPFKPFLRDFINNELKINAQCIHFKFLHIGCEQFEIEARIFEGNYIHTLTADVVYAFNEYYIMNHSLQLDISKPSE